ncbi:src-like-adapter 2 [Thalassophryne amazonica]|uniref:src-like-adapter 2 n=1 Tax=Thalassophryne amazonica TaxID=390379 RepID=UPI00147090D5|nr:src-like-adapter 2 [Thalassophryne amazonica]XP_034023155.1 src-like-adapter 2 [Thalassophryne amazonica]XP_034023156.1 src-like-adapter 2 [Thalassophryne amazonica]
MGNCPTSSHTKLTTLENPPEAAMPPCEESMVVSLQNYPSFGRTEFTVCFGEKLTIVSDDGDFLMVKSATTGRESYIPSNYTATVTDRWLFTGIKRNKAVELLMLPDNQTGAFLVRESESDTDCYSLSVLKRASSSCLGCVKHYRISRLQNGWLYISPRLTFPSLHHLVEHYSESSDGLCCQLGHPCFIQGSDNASARPLPTAIRRPTINWKDISRSMIFRRKRTESDNSLVSEGLREAISSYLYMTEGDDQSWDS